MKTIIATLLVLVTWAVRWSRWLALVQQKEYRLDRLLSFLKTQDGRSELLRFLPRRTDLTRTGFKRPKPTFRVLLVAIFSFLLMGVLTLVFIWMALLFKEASFAWWQVASIAVLIVVTLILTTPIWVLIATWPTSLFVSIYTRVLLFKARHLLSRNKVQIIGLTGSYGKTSVKFLLASMLERRFSVFVSDKSYNHALSLVKDIYKRYSQQKVVILEYGAYHVGEIARLASWFLPNQAVITGFAPQHLDLFKTRQGIVEAKSELVRALPEEGLVFYNNLDKEVEDIVSTGDPAGKRRRQGLSQFEFFKPNQIELDELGRLRFMIDNHLVKTRLVGRHYLNNIGLAWLVASNWGLTTTEIIKALEDFRPFQVFVRSLRSTNGALVIDDGGTSNPKGFRAALDIVKELAAKNNYSDIILATAGIVDLGKESYETHLDLAGYARQSGVRQVWLIGNTEPEPFRREFGKDCLESEDQIMKALSKTNQQSLILLEGRLPGWLTQAVASSSKQ